MSHLIQIAGRDIRIEGRLIRIASLKGERYTFLDDPEPILEGLRKCGTRIDLFTFMQRLPDTKPKFHYPMEWDNLAVLPVSTFDHWFTKQIRFAPRGRVRQAEKKGVTIREVPFDDTLVKGIWEIYNETPIRQGRRFPHYGKDVETVRKEEATFLDSSIFIGAYLGDKLIGFIKLVHEQTRTQANLMNIVSMVKYRDTCTTNALIAQAVRSCANRAIPYLVYQRFTYGKRQAGGIENFKEVNGFQRIDLPRYYVPLTRLGSVAFRLGLHNRWIELIPASIAARLRDLRKAWYDRRSPHPSGIHRRLSSAAQDRGCKPCSMGRLVSTRDFTPCEQDSNHGRE